MREGYRTGGPESGFLYCYSYEANLVAGHYKERHESGMLWWHRSWETHHFLPEIKIGKTARTDFEERVLEQFLGSRVGVGHPQRAILLFLMYSPRVTSNATRKGLETMVHGELKKRGYFLKNADRFEDTSPGSEWFEVNVGEAYSIATSCNRKIYEECLSDEGNEAAKLGN
jgi:T5orf172 domain